MTLVLENVTSKIPPCFFSSCQGILRRTSRDQGSVCVKTVQRTKLNHCGPHNVLYCDGQLMAVYWNWLHLKNSRIIGPPSCHEPNWGRIISGFNTQLLSVYRQKPGGSGTLHIERKMGLCFEELVKIVADLVKSGLLLLLPSLRNWEAPISFQGNSTVFGTYCENNRFLEKQLVHSPLPTRVRYLRDVRLFGTCLSG